MALARRLRSEENGEAIILVAFLIGALAMSVLLGVNIAWEGQRRVVRQSDADMAVLTACSVFNRIDDSLALLSGLAVTATTTQVVLQNDWYFNIALGSYLMQYRRRNCKDCAARGEEILRKAGFCRVDNPGRAPSFIHCPQGTYSELYTRIHEDVIVRMLKGIGEAEQELKRRGPLVAVRTAGGVAASESPETLEVAMYPAVGPIAYKEVPMNHATLAPAIYPTYEKLAAQVREKTKFTPEFKRRSWGGYEYWDPHYQSLLDNYRRTITSLENWADASAWDAVMLGKSRKPEAPPVPVAVGGREDDCDTCAKPIEDYFKPHSRREEYEEAEDDQLVLGVEVYGPFNLREVIKVPGGKANPDWRKERLEQWQDWADKYIDDVLRRGAAVPIAEVKTTYKKYVEDALIRRRMGISWASQPAAVRALAPAELADEGRWTCVTRDGVPVCPQGRLFAMDLEDEDTSGTLVRISINGCTVTDSFDLKDVLGMMASVDWSLEGKLPTLYYLDAKASQDVMQGTVLVYQLRAGTRLPEALFTPDRSYQQTNRTISWASAEVINRDKDGLHAGWRSRLYPSRTLAKLIYTPEEKILGEDEIEPEGLKDYIDTLRRRCRKDRESNIGRGIAH